MGFSGWGKIVVLLVTPGDTGGELLLLPLLANQAALHFPPLTSGIFPLPPPLSESHFLERPYLVRDTAHPTFTLAMGLLWAPCSGLVPCAPHSKCSQQAAIPAPQHPPSSRNTFCTFCLPVQGSHSANPPSLTLLQSPSLVVPLLPPAPHKDLAKGLQTSRPWLSPGLPPQQLAAANQHLQPGCSSYKLDGGELGVVTGFVVLWVELPVSAWICVLPWSLS